MSLDFGLVLPPWNFSSVEGNLLDRVVGEVGIDHLTVPVVTGEQTQFRLCHGFETPYFHTEGGWHFQPDGKLYAASGVRPRVAKWLGSRDFIGAIRERVEKLGLRLVVRVDSPRVRQVVEQAPQMSVRGAWDDPRPSFGPCPCNADLRELLRATLRDVGRYEPAGIAIQSVQTEPLVIGFSRGPLPPEVRAGLCFCPACRQIATAAGIDADAVAERIRARTAAAACAADELEPEVAAFRTARAADLRRWLDGLAETHADRQMIYVRPPAVFAHADALAGPGWIAQFRAASPASDEDLRGLFDRTEGGKAMAILADGTRGASELVSFVSRMAGGGVGAFSFEQVELAPPDFITWLKQAVRYARRESGA